uniref:1,4-alpha-glucan-branching enzyme n=1 Tax=Tanacetum cinerariifolium TaxID=118510 RepID=A0A6L2NW68_TANCI|nr:1,4-alpha-glucan-branching enzyme [Tanacetum cinerariifolium]
MRESFKSTLTFILLPLLLVTTITLHHHHRHHNTVPSSLALSTNSRWVIDEKNNGQRVKLSCVNWVSHLDAALAEGLSKQPVDAISKKILDMGFNCVRLTYPLYLFTNDTLSATTVRQSLLALGLMGSIAGVQANNPSIIDLPLINAFQSQ